MTGLAHVTHDPPPGDVAACLERLVAGFQGALVPPRISALYRLGLIAVAVAMVLLPVLYVVLAAAAGWAVFALDLAIVNSELTGRALAFSLLVVTVGGGCGVLFMFKPLLARRAAAPQRQSLIRDDEPVLFGFVDHLCRVVGAPTPAVIEVSCDVNASASFRRGLASFGGRDLRLTIGLPLVAGLTLRQFAGVLAHEFGHFSQAAGMRLTYIIRSINFWFARVVYERDEWDVRLVHHSRQGGWTGAIAGVGRGAVWATRRVLWVLMTVGNAISCFALRQMEYDADAYAIQVAGSPAFEALSLRVRELSAASAAAHGQLSSAWQEHRLAEDMPALVVAHHSALDATGLARVREDALGRRTAALDTHPADADRVARAARMDAPGLFTVDAEAAVLFSRFGALSREVTQQHYARMIGPASAEAKLQLVGDFMADGAADREASQALVELCGFVPLRLYAGAIGPLTIDAAVATESAARRVQELADQMRGSAEGARLSMNRLDALDDRLIVVEQNIGVLEGLTGHSRVGSAVAAERVAGLRKSREAMAEEAERVGLAFREHMQAAARRIELALAVGMQAVRSERLPPDSTGQLAALNCLHRCDSQLRALRLDLIRLHAAVTDFSNDPRNSQDLIAPIVRGGAVLINRLGQLRQALDVPYPFDHADGSRQLGAALIDQSPDAHDTGTILYVAEKGITRAFDTQLRLLAHLSRATRDIEKSTLSLRPAP